MKKKKIATKTCNQCMKYKNSEQVFDESWRKCIVGNVVNSKTRTCKNFNKVN